MMSSQLFCGTCGTGRPEGAIFCPKCGAGFAAAASPAPALQQGLAYGLRELEIMRMKLIVGRLAGLVIGLLIWWFVLGPASGGNPLVVLAGFAVLAFGGLYAGQLVVLSMVGGKR